MEKPLKIAIAAQVASCLAYWAFRACWLDALATLAMEAQIVFCGYYAGYYLRSIVANKTKGGE